MKTEEAASVKINKSSLTIIDKIKTLDPQCTSNKQAVEQALKFYYRYLIEFSEKEKDILRSMGRR